MLPISSVRVAEGSESLYCFLASWFMAVEICTSGFVIARAIIKLIRIDVANAAIIIR